MQLATIKSLVAAYHKKTASDLTVNGVDLFLVAANNAIRSAQQRHDFESCRLTATLDIDGQTGGSIDDAVVAANDTTTLIDNGTNVYHPAGTWSGYAFYFRVGDPATFLYYNLNRAAYVVADTLTTADPVDGTAKASDPTNPLGSYTGFGAGGDLTISINSRSSFSSIREITDIQRAGGDGYLQPLDFTSSDRAIQRVRDEIEVDDCYGWDIRYPSDSQLLAHNGQSQIVQRGRRLYIYPIANVPSTSPLSVTLQGYGWLSPYTSADYTTEDPDFFVAQGADYLQFFCIDELNLYFKTFVPRSEGNLPSPVDKAQAAFDALVKWDSFLVDPNASASR